MCHIKELEAVRFFELPVNCSEGIPIDNFELSIVPPVIFAYFGFHFWFVIGPLKCRPCVTSDNALIHEEFHWCSAK